MRARTAASFARVSERYACAVISGRALADVSRRLGDARVKYVVGNHGGEPHARALDFEAEVGSARERLSSALQDCDGIEIEDKRYSLAIHFRAAPDPRRARSIVQAAATLTAPLLRQVPGKMVLNLVPMRAPDKGRALQRLVALEQCEFALYVGDDVTDEDVFRLDASFRLLAIRIGETKASAARFYLRDQAEIDAFLDQLLALSGADTS